MMERVRTGGKPTHAPAYLCNSVSKRHVRWKSAVQSLRTFLVGIKYTSVCVSQGKLVGDWRCFPFALVIHQARIRRCVC